jgi:uncharacterized membrane protein
MESSMLRTIEKPSALDGLAEPFQRVVHDALHRAPAVARVLHGRWLGHPLHAAATDVPVGAWATAVVLDGLGAIRKEKAIRRGADLAIYIGLAGASVAALSGLADYSHTDGAARRVGFLHGISNVVVTSLFIGSAVARKRGRRPVGIALSAVGFGLALFSTWLGGKLVYDYGVGVEDRDRPDEPFRARFESTAVAPI